MIVVDNLFDARIYYGRKGHDPRTIRNGNRNNHLWCHMTSTESEEELHEFARRLGLQRTWYDGDHYDLTPGRRLRAVQMGAVEVDSKGLLNAIRMRQGRNLL